MGFFDKMLGINPYTQEMERTKNRLYSVYGDADERRMRRGMVEGTKMGEELVGQSASEVGQRRRDIAGRIYAAMDEPSMRAKEAQVIGADRMRQLKANQKRGQMAGGAAMGQQYEQGFKSDLAAAGVAQEDRIMLEDRARQEAGSAAKGIASQRAAEGGLAIASKKVEPAQVRSGGGLTIICTELFNQGYMDAEIMARDAEYGYKIRQEAPHIYDGYIFLASPIVSLMRRSSAFTSFVAIFALSWAYDMAGYRNPFGKMINRIGAPICGAVGKVLNLFNRTRRV
jgi:hypothetical protein